MSRLGWMMFGEHLAKDARDAMAAGDELLIDYGHGASLSNERLLLEYGFVLKGAGHANAEDSLELPFGAVAVGLAAVQEAAAAFAPAGGEADDAADDALLGARQQALLSQLGDTSVSIAPQYQSF